MEVAAVVQLVASNADLRSGGLLEGSQAVLQAVSGQTAVNFGSPGPVEKSAADGNLLMDSASEDADEFGERKRSLALRTQCWDRCWVEISVPFCSAACCCLERIMQFLAMLAVPYHERHKSSAVARTRQSILGHGVHR